MKLSIKEVLSHLLNELKDGKRSKILEPRFHPSTALFCSINHAIWIKKDAFILVRDFDNDAMTTANDRIEILTKAIECYEPGWEQPPRNMSEKSDIVIAVKKWLNLPRR